MTPEEVQALVPGARMEFNRGDCWLPVVYVGPSRGPKHPDWLTVRHVVMKWEHNGPIDQYRMPGKARGRPWQNTPRQLRLDTIAGIREDAYNIRASIRTKPDARSMAEAAQAYEAAAAFLTLCESANIARVAHFAKGPDTTPLGTDE